ncbi:hypothetical protein [Chromobacterium subtsugae]|uniref:hypothetical protein n=1 Tax=Chromobacterium subtsugae TaxID=251747 RepID=UPI00069C4AD5|nr:hypothetical protein [Chromobacterium subtsugae]
MTCPYDRWLPDQPAPMPDQGEERFMTTNHINGVHVYEMNDCDWVVARSEQEAQAYYCDLNGEDDPPRALTAEELDRLDFFVDAEKPDGHSITFRERLQQLVDNNEQIPDLFATTEY